MAAIGFVGLGNMGGPMAANLIKAGHKLRVFDLSQPAIAKLVEAGAEAAPSASDAAKGADAVITMLPAGAHVRDIYLGPQGLIASAPPRLPSHRLLDHRRGDGTRSRAPLPKRLASTCSTRRSRAESAARKERRSLSWRAEARAPSSAPSRSCPPWARP